MFAAKAEYRANIARIQSQMNPVSKDFYGSSHNRIDAEIIRDIFGGKLSLTIRRWKGTYYVYPKRYKFREWKKKFLKETHVP